MNIDLMNPTLPEANASATELARQLFEQHGFSKADLKDATGTILLLRAQSNIAGFGIENELDKLAEFVSKCKALNNALNEIAGE